MKKKECIFLKNLDRIQNQLESSDDRKLLLAIACMLGLYIEHELDKCKYRKHKKYKELTNPTKELKV